MIRWKAVLLLVVVFALAGCVAPIAPDPYPYSFTNPDKEPYPRTEEGARQFVADSRILWRPEHNSIVYSPIMSARWLRGDCDDFAVMVAYYLQEFWGYDTFICILRSRYYGLEDHACAFLCSYDASIDYGMLYCPDYPYLKVGLYETPYYPVDFGECPDWSWDYYYRDEAFVYDWVLDLWQYKTAFEWYDLVDKALSIPTPEPRSNSCQDAIQCPAPVFDQGRP